MSEQLDTKRLGNVEFINFENLPDEPVVVVPSWIDFESLVQLQDILKDKNIAYLVPEGAPFDPKLGELLLGASEIIGIDRNDPYQESTKQEIHEALSQKKTVVFIPEPSLAIPGAVSKIPAETLQAICDFGLPTIPLFVTNSGVSRLAVEKDIGDPTIVAFFGELLNGDKVTYQNIQQVFYDGSEAAFSRRSILNINLGRLLIRGLKNADKNAKIIDGFDKSELTYDKVLAAGIALAEYIKKSTKKDRVGIILTPGKAGLIANLAVILAGKVPVNLNFTASREAIESAIRRSDVDKFLTADPFVRKQPTFPWPANRQLILLDRILPQLKSKIIKWGILNKFLPLNWIYKKLDLPSGSGDLEGALLFTSGSSGEPKGVVLTQRNFIANVVQFSTRLGLSREDKVVGTLPLFHSFGCTVSLWYPMIEGLSLVTYPSPLETNKIAELIHEYKPTLLLGTATFFRGYMRRVKAEQLAPLKYIVAGAEKLPISLGDAFEKKFNRKIREGYGLTETSPVTNFNMPNPVHKDSDPADIPILPSCRDGSVGHFMNGMSVRIKSAETGELLPINETGIILLKGANVFNGYLNDKEKTEEVFDDGWFVTGDMGRVDEEGFLFIEGRLSRFSKIGGEMVPHETVEESINQALDLHSDEVRKVAVIGLPDERKGEALYLLSTVATEMFNQELIDLRYTLLEKGTPALWVPKQIIPVDEIPILATGKLDIKGCEELAKSKLGLD